MSEQIKNPLILRLIGLVMLVGALISTSTGVLTLLIFDSVGALLQIAIALLLAKFGLKFVKKYKE